MNNVHCMYTLCPSISGHLGYSYILAFVNDAVVNMGVCQKVFEIPFLILLYMFPELGLPDYMAVLFLIF